MPRRRERADRRGERPRGNEFMDVAREAFVRAVALGRWRELTRLVERIPVDAALREAGRFPGRAAYQDLWVRRWSTEVTPGSVADAASLFAAIERAIAAAVQDEEAARRARGDRPLDLDPEYRAFLDQALGRVGAEATGGLEPSAGSGDADGR